MQGRTEETWRMKLYEMGHKQFLLGFQVESTTQNLGERDLKLCLIGCPIKCAFIVTLCVCFWGPQEMLSSTPMDPGAVAGERDPTVKMEELIRSEMGRLWDGGWYLQFCPSHYRDSVGLGEE